jgi:hypothetical protein
VNPHRRIVAPETVVVHRFSPTSPAARRAATTNRAKRKSKTALGAD